ncbi:hypothetical protein A2U01_0086403, partial [Trifolium medium]|nr:hypothetical protein [Trifolium medium]
RRREMAKIGQSKNAKNPPSGLCASCTGTWRVAPLILQEEEKPRILAQVAQVLAGCAVDFEKKG